MTKPVRCWCGRRLVGTEALCVRCLLEPGSCTCDDLTRDAEGWGEIAFLPAGKYRVVAAPGGWSVESQDDGSGWG